VRSLPLSIDGACCSLACCVPRATRSLLGIDSGLLLAGAEGDSKGEEPSEEAEAADEGPLLDPKEALKRLKSQKSTKKTDSVAARAKAAIEEAAKRKAKLAKAKSKDKSHYNQQPVR
jgi:hypothetical protein